MNILLIHGDDTGASYDFYMETISAAKQKGWDILTVESDAHLADSIRFRSTLFAPKVLWAVKDIPTDKLQSIFSHAADDVSSIVVYFSKAIGVNALKALPKDSKIKRFDISKSIYVFFDTLYPGNLASVMRIKENVIANYPIELLFTLMVKHIRDLYWVLVDASSTGYPGWRVGKLKSQAAKFGKERLAQAISQLSDIDIKTKTSKGDLNVLLDLFLAKALQ